ncbi:restriction endonuclease [Alcanivorax sp. JB21]|uniref:restriction endonuclease n=1 Tax=Alcanivorax limicola TaxID=2874102 RepID=UPI001CBBC9E6|nr:restriction endonuclease [Alcanivorax limicola]MBZ2189399.1 restriction endonuclease [Alcanivorax limicola]
MASISQIRGALLEEAVLYLLEKFGYETIEPFSGHADESLRGGHSGLEVRGRGSWHQIDALAAFRSSPAFMYPLRLMVEAKCYQENRPVGIEVVRNAVGVLKDISENYFSVVGDDASIKIPRFNYYSSIFSTSGYTAGAINYALAHQIFLIQYEKVPVIQPLIDAIMRFDESCVTGCGKAAIAEVRKQYRGAIRSGVYEVGVREYITPRGLELIDNALVELLSRIQGSYFGMLQGRWPLHLLTRRPLSSAAFQNDIVRCRVTGDQTGEWKFSPEGFYKLDQGWFELEFSLPDDVAKLVNENWGDRERVANIKKEYFSYIDLSGIIDGIRRSVRLELDRDWIDRYIKRIRRRD